jgi:hypothetical protein
LGNPLPLCPPHSLSPFSHSSHTNPHPIPPPTPPPIPPRPPPSPFILFPIPHRSPHSPSTPYLLHSWRRAETQTFIYNVISARRRFTAHLTQGGHAEPSLQRHQRMLEMQIFIYGRISARRGAQILMYDVISTEWRRRPLSAQGGNPVPYFRRK